MPTVLRVKKGVNADEGHLADLAAWRPDDLETRIAVIQALIPLGLQAGGTPVRPGPPITWCASVDVSAGREAGAGLCGDRDGERDRPRRVLASLGDRGLRCEQGLLVIMDGGKGLRAAVRRVFGPHTPVQRCA